MSAPMSHVSNVRPKADKVLTLIAGYAKNYSIKSQDAYDTARYCLMDSLGCARASRSRQRWAGGLLRCAQSTSSRAPPRV